MPTMQRPACRSICLARNAAVAALAGTAAVGLVTAGATQASAKGRPDTVKLVNHKGLGKILVNGAGRTVYIFTGDHPNKATCGGVCASIWPPLTVKKGTRVFGGPGVGHLGTIAAGRNRQVTWNRHPLYLYSLDTRSGVGNGNGVKQGSSVWYAATANRVDAKWPTTTTTRPTSGGSPPATGYGY